MHGEGGGQPGTVNNATFNFSYLHVSDVAWSCVIVID